MKTYAETRRFIKAISEIAKFTQKEIHSDLIINPDGGMNIILTDKKEFLYKYLNQYEKKWWEFWKA